MGVIVLFLFSAVAVHTVSDSFHVGIEKLQLQLQTIDCPRTGIRELALVEANFRT